MATPNIVPRADGEGGLGTSSKGWGNSFITGNLEIQSGSSSTLSKIMLGTDSNKATIGVSGGTDTFFTSTTAGDLILRADNNNDKIHLGSGTSGIAAMVITEVSNVGKVGIGTAVPGVPLEVLDSTASSATQGGNLRLSANDGAVMASGHRLGVIEFAGAEDAGGSITVGARIEALCDATWSASENGADLVFYTTDGNASQSKVLTLSANKLATFESGVAVTTGNVTITEATSGIRHTNSGTVTQGTSITTGVTLNTTSGVITMYATAIARENNIEFIVTNSTVETDSIILLTMQDENTVNDVQLVCATHTIGSGAFTITVANTNSALSSSATASKIHFLIIN